MSTNHNVCATCLDEAMHPSLDVADTGVCGKCGFINDVWDVEVIRLYTEAKIPDDKVWQALPRLRCSCLPGAKEISLEVIHQEISAFAQSR